MISARFDKRKGLFSVVADGSSQMPSIEVKLYLTWNIPAVVDRSLFINDTLTRSGRLS